MLALGRDDRNLAALTAAFEHDIPQPGAELIVEIDDLALALRLAVQLVVERPGASIEVICVDEARAAFASAQMVDAFARVFGFRDARSVSMEPEAIEALERDLSDEAASANVPVVAVVGDGVLPRLIVEHLAAGLGSLGSLTSRSLFPLVVVEPDARRRAELERIISDPSKVATSFAPEHRALLHEWSPGSWEAGTPILAVVDYVDPGETARRAVELVCTRPQSTVWVPGEHELLPGDEVSAQAGAPRGHLHVLSRRAMEDARYLVGPFHRVAQLHNDDADLRNESERDRLPTRPGAGEERQPIEHWAPAQVRSGVRTLERCGWNVVPALGVAWTAEPRVEALLDEHTRRELAGTAGGALRDGDQLVHWLAQVGLAVTRAPDDHDRRNGRLDRMADVAMPEDDAIEVMARLIHGNYIEARKAEGEFDAEHPAMKPWEQLSAKLRGQNRDQARNNVLKLASIGLRVVPAAGGEAEPVGLTEDQVLVLARREHERWGTQKRAQGYRYGQERMDTGDKQHPDLVAWEELTDADREKDIAPVRQIVAVLAEAGYTVVPAATE